MVLHKNNSLVTLLLTTVTILSGLYLSSSYSFATSASTTASVKVATSCTLTTTGGGNYSATIPNGTSSEIEGSTLSISCNDAEGFALYAVGFSDSTVGNNSMIGASTNISTNTSGNNSYWAMKVNPVSGNTPTIENSFNNYHIIPDTHTKVASYNQSTSGSLAVTSTYKVNISSSQLAGNYLGKVKYTLVHPANEIPQQEIACDPGKICYNANTNIVEGQMGKQTPDEDELDGNYLKLWASNYKRDGYGFAGWNDQFDYSGTFYGPNQLIDLPSDLGANGLSLYAVWVESDGRIQNWDGCDGMNINEVTALTDGRDNDTYAVAKLADGKCWMIENLRLDDSATLSDSNTHIPLLPLINVYETNSFSNHLSPTSSVAYDAANSPEGWCTVQTSNCVDHSTLRTDNTVLFINNNSSNYDVSGNVYSYGNYYNWYSATAGHGKYGSDYNSNYTAPGDICPAGWHLPTNNTTINEFGFLHIALGGSDVSSSTNTNPTGVIMSRRMRSYPNNFILSGQVNGDSIMSRYGNGDYWTSTGANANNAKGFSLNSIMVNSNLSPFKRIGSAVRCIAKSSNLPE